ncbi:fibronectin type III domain-containing protein, partial [Flavobacterium sp. LBUM151]
KTKYIFIGLITVLFLTIGVSGCESYNEELLDGIGNTREFSPLGLKAIIRNNTSVELNWTVKEDENADHYVVEFSADDPEFKTIYKSIKVAPTQLPILVALEGETNYSIRVKAVSAAGLEDSKWSIITAATLSEQIFFPIKAEEIEAGSVTLRWTPNSNVTEILFQPGNIVHTITPEEKTAGMAIATGLTPETNYTATLKNGSKTRGILTFTSG